MVGFWLVTSVFPLVVAVLEGSPSIKMKSTSLPAARVADATLLTDVGRAFAVRSRHHRARPLRPHATHIAPETFFPIRKKLPRW